MRTVYGDVVVTFTGGDESVKDEQCRNALRSPKTFKYMQEVAKKICSNINELSRELKITYGSVQRKKPEKSRFRLASQQRPLTHLAFDSQVFGQKKVFSVHIHFAIRFDTMGYDVTLNAVEVINPKVAGIHKDEHKHP